MDFERYYIDLFEMLNYLCKKIASGKYDDIDADKLFDLAKTGKYPGLLTELAESFGMMMMKVEGRELHLKQVVEELEKAKAKLEEHSKTLEQKIVKQNGEKLSSDTDP